MYRIEYRLGADAKSRILGAGWTRPQLTGSVRLIKSWGNGT
jgi:hypothetical protein